MTVFDDIEQGSDEWKALRKGKPTASRFSDIITSTGKLSKSAAGYIRELIGECFCPDFEAWAGNNFMDRGLLLQDEAANAFMEETGLAVAPKIGFCLADDGVCGCSPDGLIIGQRGDFVSGVEIKCPIPKTHVGYVLDGKLPDEYRQQVHGSMAVTGFSEWHFWSYFPGMRHLHIVVKRDDYTKLIEDALSEFVSQYQDAMAEAVPKLQIKL